MIDNYHIEEMVLQSQQVVVYRMVDDAGREYALSRFILPKDVLIALNDGRFPQCLKELMGITHGCLRPVIDGGLDPVDRSPWLATYWWDGRTLLDRMQDKELTSDDVQRVEQHAKSVMAGVGQFAAFLNFDPGKIVAVKGAAGDFVETFTIDLYQWFLSWATGRPPAPDREPNRQLATLLSRVRKSVVGSTPRASSPMLPPPKTTSLATASLGPTTVSLGALSTQQIGGMALGGTSRSMLPPAGTSSASPKKGNDPLAAYRKKVSKGQKVGVAAAVLFIAAAVGGIGFMILRERERPRVAKQQSLEQSETVVIPKKETLLDRLAKKVERDRARRPQIDPIDFGGRKPGRAIVLEEGSGPRIEGGEEIMEASSATTQPATGTDQVQRPARPNLLDMPEILPSRQINLGRFVGSWVVLTGKVQSLDEGIIFDGPDSLRVRFDPEVSVEGVGSGDLVEVIGWVDPNGGNPFVVMEKSKDLELLEKAASKPTSRIFTVTDQAQIKELAGSEVTVIAEVVALSDASGDKDRVNLYFDESGNGFAASVVVAESEDLNLSFLEQFVGQQVKVSGRVSLGSASELLIELRRRDQINIQG